MPAQNSVRGIPNGGRDLITLVALVVGCYIAWTTRWLSLIAIGAFVLWTFLAHRKDLWSKATAPFLLSAAVGVAALTLFVFALDVGGLIVSPDGLMGLEYRLIAIRLALKQATSYSTFTLLLIVAALLAINVRAPQSHAVKLWFGVTGKVSKVIIALSAALSFTFFSAVPANGIEQALFERMIAHGLVAVDRYNVSIRTEWDAVARYLTAAYVAQEIPHFTTAQKTSYQDLLGSIQAQSSVVVTVHQCDQRSQNYVICSGLDLDDPLLSLFRAHGARNRGTPSLSPLPSRGPENVNTRDPDIKKTVSVSNNDRLKVVDRFIDKQLAAANIGAASRPRTPESTDPSIARFEHVEQLKPATFEDWRDLKEALDALELPVARQVRQAEEAKERGAAAQLAARNLFIKTVVPELPGIEGVAGAYINALIDKLAESMLDRALQKAATFGIPVSKPQDALSILQVVPSTDILGAKLFPDKGPLMSAWGGATNRDAVEDFVTSETAKVVYDRAALEISAEATERSQPRSPEGEWRVREGSRISEGPKSEFRFLPR